VRLKHRVGWWQCVLVLPTRKDRIVNNMDGSETGGDFKMLRLCWCYARRRRPRRIEYVEHLEPVRPELDVYIESWNLAEYCTTCSTWITHGFHTAQDPRVRCTGCTNLATGTIAVVHYHPVPITTCL
jgi:hypothetical protein